MLWTILLSAAAASPASAPIVLALPDRCDSSSTLVSSPETPKAGLHPLGEEPPASQLLTVYREVDGCPMPVVLKRGIGGRGKAAPNVQGGGEIRPLR